jgi:hypothetical protein
MRGKDMSWFSHEELGDRQFNVTRRWLPTPLSAGDGIACLSRAEALKLSRVEFGAHVHLLGCVEEFIAPPTITLVRGIPHDEREMFAALSSAATDEVGRRGLFLEVRARVNDALGFALALLPETRRAAGVVLAKRTGAVRLLTACLQAPAETYCLRCAQDHASLDVLARQILTSYWRDAARRARRGRLETIRAFQALAVVERDEAIDDFVELVIGLEALLHVQSRFDVENLQRYIRRSLGKAEHEEVLAALMAAKRHTFVQSGLTDPGFLEMFSLVATRDQRQRVEEALETEMATIA